MSIHWYIICPLQNLAVHKFAFQDNCRLLRHWTISWRSLTLFVVIVVPHVTWHWCLNAGYLSSTIVLLPKQLKCQLHFSKCRNDFSLHLLIRVGRLIACDQFYHLKNYFTKKRKLSLIITSNINLLSLFPIIN